MNRNNRARYSTKDNDTKKFFGRISFRTFALSLVALIQIALLLVGATYAWVETISSIKFDGATGNVGTAVKKIVNLTNTDSAVFLDDYFEQVGGDTHLSACSSADAENFYFPIVGEDNTRYRRGTINDKNVNYVDFDFQIKNETDTEKTFRFNEVPDVPNNVRIAIWADGYTPKIFGNRASTDKDTVVCSTGGGTTKANVLPFSSYTADDETNDSAIFKIASNCTATIYVKLWLQQDTSTTTESTETIDIKNVRLVSGVAQKTVTVDYCKDSNDTMGDISINDTGEKTVMVDKGQTVTLKHKANAGYKFMGWYTDREGTKKAELGSGNTFTVGSQSATFFAKFKKICKIKVIAVDCEEADCKAINKKAGAVRIAGTDSSEYITSMESSDYAQGETITIRAKAIDLGHEFAGWYNKEEFILDNLVSSEINFNVKLPEDAVSVTYYAQFKPKTVVITASAYKNSENKFCGKVTDCEKTDTVVNVETNYDGSAVTFSPVESEEGYVFDGWFGNPECTENLKNDDFFSYTINGNDCKVTIKKYKEQANVYAKFRLKRYTVNVYAQSYFGDNEVKNAKYGTVTYTYNGSLAPESALKHENIAVEFGKKITLQAKNYNNYCEFDGWYTKNSNGNYVKITDDKSAHIKTLDYSPTLKGSDNEVYNFYAKFDIKTKDVAVVVPDSYKNYGKVHIGDNTTMTERKFLYGDEITLKAVPTANTYNKYKFSGWYGNKDCTGEPIKDSDGNIIGKNYDITVDDNTLNYYYAKFEIQKKTYRLHPEPPDGCSSVDILVDKKSVGVFDALTKKDKTYEAEYSTSMDFTVSPGDYYKVEAWYKRNTDGALQKISNSEGQTEIKGIISQESESDYFEVKLVKKQKSVTVINKPDGQYGDSDSSISIDGISRGTTGTFDYGTELEITATPDQNHNFVGWYTDASCTTKLTDDLSFTVTVNDDVKEKYYAKFEYKQKTISVDLGTGVTGGSVNINGTADTTSVTANYGDTVNLVATTNDLTYEFTGWYKTADCSGTPVSTDATYSITVGDDTSAKYYAKFDKKKLMTLYFKNTSNWENVYVYMWGSSGYNKAYPGDKDHITKIGTTQYYKFDVDLSKGYTNIIFNPGNDNGKTGDLTLPSVTDEKNCFVYDTSVDRNGYWTKYGEEPTTTTAPPTTTTAPPQKVITFDASAIEKGDERWAAYLWNRSKTIWVDMPNKTLTVPNGYENLIICRMNGTTTENNWNNVWNKSVNLSVNDGTKYTAIGWGSDNKFTGKWD